MDRLLMSLLLIILSLSVIRILGLLLVLRFTNHRLQTIIPDEPLHKYKIFGSSFLSSESWSLEFGTQYAFLFYRGDPQNVILINEILSPAQALAEQAYQRIGHGR